MAVRLVGAGAPVIQWLFSDTGVIVISAVAILLNLIALLWPAKTSRRP